MKAAMLRSFGNPDCLQYETVDTPEPAYGEFLINVEAAGVNPVDAKIRSGEFARFVPRLPAIIGRDICGTIVTVGRDTDGLVKGDRVMGMLDYDRGAYAEYVVASKNELTRKPMALDAVHAAAIPVAALTAWQALFEHGRVLPQQRVLIHGAGGGVGHFAVQFASLHGAEVIGVCPEEDMDFVRELGAVATMDYRSSNFESLVGEIHVVIDLIGGKTRSRSWELLHPGGVLVSTLPSPTPEGREDVSGREVVVHSDSSTLQHIAALAVKKMVNVSLGSVFPLEKANDAHWFMQDKHSRGKTVLRVTGTE